MPKIMKRFKMVRTETCLSVVEVDAMTKKEALATTRCGFPGKVSYTKWKIIGEPVELRGHPRSEC